MPSILVIDNDAAVRVALEKVLKSRKYGVVVAPDGLTGLGLIGSIMFDAVIIDMFMPGMDGLATIRELTKVKPTLPFVVTSSRALTAPRKGATDFLGMAVRLGAATALQKPINAAELLDAIDGCVASRGQSRDGDIGP